jgi:hypothetical protein
MSDPFSPATVKSDAELKSAIEGLYRTFSRYPLPPHVDGCPHCVSDKDHALLYSKELRDLGPDELKRYAFKAMSTWGDEDDFRHFLPRIFEVIAVAGESFPIDLEILFGKLAYGHWETWPADERRAITSFFEAIWSDVLDRFPHEFSAEDCLCGIAQAVDDMTRCLERWRIGQSLAHAKHFAEFVQDNLEWSSRHGWSLNGPFWRRRPAPARQVVDWLRDPVRKSELKQAFFHLAPEGEDAALLSSAIDDLTRLS